jgi:hypothetical protein
MFSISDEMFWSEFIKTAEAGNSACCGWASNL